MSKEIWPSMRLDIDDFGSGIRGGYDLVPSPPPPQDEVDTPPPPPPSEDKESE
jgi:hypothetical protein